MTMFALRKNVTLSPASPLWRLSFRSAQAPGALRLPDQTGVKLQLVAPLVVGITEGEPALAAAVKTHRALELNMPQH